MDFVAICGIVTLLLDETFSSLGYILREFSSGGQVLGFSHSCLCIPLKTWLFFFLFCCYSAQQSNFVTYSIAKEKKTLTKDNLVSPTGEHKALIQ